MHGVLRIEVDGSRLLNSDPIRDLIRAIRPLGLCCPQPEGRHSDPRDHPVMKVRVAEGTQVVVGERIYQGGEVVLCRGGKRSSPSRTAMSSPRETLRASLYELAGPRSHTAGHG